MHYGIVTDTDALEATVALTVQAYDDTAERLTFLIGTGFYGSLTLSQEVVERLNLPPGDVKEVEITLPDALTANANLYKARILWHGRPREVEVISLENDFLIGMGLLRGSNLNIDAIPGGSVTITELSTAP